MATKGSCAAGTCPKNACKCEHPVILRLKGKWRENSVENLESFANHLGMNMRDKEMGDLKKFHEEWDMEGDTVTLKMTNPFQQTSATFKLDEEIQQNTIDGKTNAKTIYTEEGSKLMCRQERQPHNMVIMREIKTDGIMRMTMKVEDMEDGKHVICTVNFTQETMN